MELNSIKHKKNMASIKNFSAEKSAKRVMEKEESYWVWNKRKKFIVGCSKKLLGSRKYEESSRK